MSGKQPPAHGQHKDEAAAGQGKKGLVGWLLGHRLISVLGIVVVAVSISAGMYFATPAQQETGPVTLEMAFATLDQGALEEARSMAEQLRDRGDVPLSQAGSIPYLLGMVASRQSDEVFDANRVSLCLVAARYLEDARDLGFPEGTEAEGLWRLGKSLHRAGELAACQEPLESALKGESAESAEIHRLLADAYLNAPEPRLDLALQHSQKYLADESLTDERAAALLQQGEILFRQQDFAACREVLAQIPRGSTEHADGVILEGRTLMGEAEQLRQAGDADARRRQAVVEKYQAAMEVIRRPLAVGQPQGRASRRAHFLIGLCYEALGDPAAALEQYKRLVAAHEASPEALAGSVQMAELLRTAGRDEEAATAWRRALDAMPEAESYRNPWLPLETFRKRALAAHEAFRAAEKFERVLTLVEGFHPLFPRPRQVQLLAEAHRAWASALKGQVDAAPYSQREGMRGQSLAQFQQAGRQYRRLAELRFAEREYPDDLWNASECFVDGRDYASAVRILNTYLDQEPFHRRSQALFRLGEALLVQGKLDEAIAALRESIEFDPQNAINYRCRVLASKAYLEKGETATAEKLLLENLQSDLLTPASLEWRESLFSLGTLLHLEGRYAEAALRLEEAVSRYPTARQTLECRYLIADCHRQAAKAMLAKLESAVVESARNAQAKELHRLLEAAIEQYDQAVAILQPRQEPGGNSNLTSAEETILRNCHFMKGSALFEMGRYDEAIRAWSTATNRYQHAPEVLDAYVQIADCYRRLNRPTEAKAAIEQAKVVLNRIPADADFAEVTNLSRQDWARHLEWLSTL